MGWVLRTNRAPEASWTKMAFAAGMAVTIPRMRSVWAGSERRAMEAAWIVVSGTSGGAAFPAVVRMASRGVTITATSMTRPMGSTTGKAMPDVDDAPDGIDDGESDARGADVLAIQAGQFQCGIPRLDLERHDPLGRGQHQESVWLAGLPWAFDGRRRKYDPLDRDARELGVGLLELGGRDVPGLGKP